VGVEAYHQVDIEVGAVVFFYIVHIPWVRNCRFVPTTGRGSLLPLFLRTSVLKALLILHLLLITTDNFGCSHLRETSLNIADVITTKCCMRGAFLSVHNTFRGSYLPKTVTIGNHNTCSFLFVFRKLRSVGKLIDVMSDLYLEV
jgi:hypothetical protein